ncbi:MAG: hypothetical protein AAF431_06865 [Pseudomonadota bacterium]
MKTINPERRKLIGLLGIGGAAAVAAPAKWSKPVIDAVLLPAHAQTSCVTDTTVGGPLIGNASGAMNCQDACEAEATSQGAQLCSVSETLNAANEVQCGCDLDLP